MASRPLFDHTQYDTPMELQAALNQFIHALSNHHSGRSNHPSLPDPPANGSDSHVGTKRRRGLEDSGDDRHLIDRLLDENKIQSQKIETLSRENGALSEQVLSLKRRLDAVERSISSNAVTDLERHIPGLKDVRLRCVDSIEWLAAWKLVQSSMPVWLKKTSHRLRGWREIKPESMLKGCGMVDSITKLVETEQPKLVLSLGSTEEKSLLDALRSISASGTEILPIMSNKVLFSILQYHRIASLVSNDTSRFVCPHLLFQSPTINHTYSPAELRNFVQNLLSLFPVSSSIDPVTGTEPWMICGYAEIKNVIHAWSIRSPAKEVELYQYGGDKLSSACIQRMFQDILAAYLRRGAKEPATTAEMLLDGWQYSTCYLPYVEHDEDLTKYSRALALNTIFELVNMPSSARQISHFRLVQSMISDNADYLATEEVGKLIHRITCMLHCLAEDTISIVDSIRASG